MREREEERLAPSIPSFHQFALSSNSTFSPNTHQKFFLSLSDSLSLSLSDSLGFSHSFFCNRVSTFSSFLTHSSPSLSHSLLVSNFPETDSRSKRTLIQVRGLILLLLLLLSLFSPRESFFLSSSLEKEEASFRPVTHYSLKFSLSFFLLSRSKQKRVSGRKRE